MCFIQKEKSLSRKNKWQFSKTQNDETKWKNKILKPWKLNATENEWKRITDHNLTVHKCLINSKSLVFPARRILMYEIAQIFGNTTSGNNCYKAIVSKQIF